MSNPPPGTAPRVAMHPPLNPKELHSDPQTRASLEEVIFGIMDGAVTNLAVVAGVAAAASSTSFIVTLAALAAMLAGSLSMFTGAYVSGHARYELAMRERRMEYEEIKVVPDAERAEVREIYLQQGFSPDEAEILTKRVTSDPDRWVAMMMRDELGFSDDELIRPPIRHGIIIGLSYLLGSIFALAPFAIANMLPGSVSGLPNLHGLTAPLLGAVLLSILIFAALGAMKERFGSGRPVKGALQLVAIGLATAALVFLISYAITSIV